MAGNVGAYADPMAEHVLAMALALAKRLPQNQARMAEGIFDRAETLRLRGRTVGILGYGGIGKACARLFRPFGTRIYAINTSGRADENADQAGTLADLHDMLAAADIVVVTLPLTRATRGLIGAPELGLMKADAILVNVARGAIVDEDALFEHLKAHPDFCAGIDTWWDEPKPGQPFRPRLPFLSLPNVIGSPHNSGDVPGMSSASIRPRPGTSPPTSAATGRAASRTRPTIPRPAPDRRASRWRGSLASGASLPCSGLPCLRGFLAGGASWLAGLLGGQPGGSSVMPPGQPT